MKTRVQNVRNVERLGRAAAAQNNEANAQWLRRAGDDLRLAAKLLHRRAKALGIPSTQVDRTLGEEASAEHRFYFYRGAFWQVQAELATGLLANKTLSADCIADLVMAKTRLAQSLCFDFGGSGLKPPAMDLDSAQKQIGAWIAAKRDGKGMTQAALAKSIGMSAPSVARIEAGQRRLSIVALYNMAHALGLPVSDLIPKSILFHADDISLDQIRKIEVALRALSRALEERKKALKARST